jgi:glycine betaine transporter
MRRLHSLLVACLLAPTLLGFFWFAVFGGTALWAQIFGHADLVQALAEGIKRYFERNPPLARRRSL